MFQGYFPFILSENNDLKLILDRFKSGSELNKLLFAYAGDKPDILADFYSQNRCFFIKDIFLETLPNREEGFVIIEAIDSFIGSGRDREEYRLCYLIDETAKKNCKLLFTTTSHELKPLLPDLKSRLSLFYVIKFN